MERDYDRDEALFAKEMADVTPLKPSNTVVSFKRDPQLTDAQRARRAQAQKEEEATNFLSDEFVDLLPVNDPFEFRRDGIQTGVIDKLRQGGYRIDAQINVARQPLRDVRRDVFAFIREAYAHELRTLLIVHGRGKRDDSHANIVRSYVTKWLQQFDEVQAFSTAQPRNGGLGATYVALKKSASASQRNRERHQRRHAP
ncbi:MULTISPECIES: DNA endonuclease SmrA [Larsenimonas]|uniref:DNA endonuclease SmrA n=1 Tax=Larsenimonas suaedae TaxID=1851019 RepID=A0ABU1GX72_9GAMM|nr:MULTISPECIES: DNA endonuclease SmrA [Larsenimonas]MCM2971388.1 DNA endonuclease SmrA [Larsenimonas suaedae]MCM5703495.1 DNA endonuclease SmrA [Larsenimonas salina]MDR5896644.1 DNA endonuclease SmrA [Larsenimonas suaedae]